MIEGRREKDEEKQAYERERKKERHGTQRSVSGEEASGD